MNFRRAGFVILAMTTLFIAILLFFCCLTGVMKGSQELPGSWGIALAIPCIVIRAASFVLLFLVFPEMFLLLRLRETELWTRLFVGGVSGGFSMFALFADTWSGAIIQKSKSVPEAMLWALKVHFGDPVGLLSAFIKYVDMGSLIFTVLLGMAIGAFFWAPIYRLPGDNQRDWDQPILGGRPPYAK